MSTGSVFYNNKSQAVRLPADSRFPDTVKRVVVRVVGNVRIISPAEKSWESFFLSEEGVSDDFLTDREDFPPEERESFDD